MDLLRQLQRMGTRSETNAAGAHSAAPNPRRAVRNWRVVLEKISDLIAFMVAQARVALWQGGGSSGGYAVSCSSMGPSSGQSSRLEPISKEKAFKAEVFKELIKSGEALGQRKCKEAPAMTPQNCFHPAAQLMGAGNQSQREVWCKQCHMRWLVDPSPMEDLKKGQATVTVGGKMMLSGKSGVAAAPDPKTSMRSPNTPTLTPSSPQHSIQCQDSKSYQHSQSTTPASGEVRLRGGGHKANEMRLQQELEKAHRREEQLKMEMQERVNATMLEAERRHNIDANQQMQACQAQVEQMHQQLIWMTAAAGEERLANLMRDQSLQEEVNAQERILRSNLEEQHMPPESPEVEMVDSTASWSRC